MVKVYKTLIFCVFISLFYQTSEAQKLYFSDNGAVKRMNLDGSSPETIVAGPGFDYIAVDGYNNYLFYNDGQQTYRALLDGSSPEVVTDDGAMAGYSNIEVIPDYEEVLYVGILEVDEIYRGSYYDDEFTSPAVINTGIDQPGDEEYLDIAYNKSDERIYFTGVNSTAVYTTLRDGSNLAQIISNGAYGPIGIDYLNDKVYWVRYTAGDFFIMNADLDGSSPTTLLSNGGASIESLDVYPEQNAVFFSQGNEVYRMALNGTGKTLLFTGTYIRTVAIDFDITPPTFYGLVPLNGATNVAVNANLTLSFSEFVKRSLTTGSGDELSFRIYETTGNVLVETIDRSSSAISISGNTVTINPSITFDYNTDYYVMAGAKVISDYSDNNWVGITTSGGWAFKSENDPSVFYSRQNGNWNNVNTWSHAGHTGPAASSTPGTGADVIIGNGHTVTLTSPTSVVGATSTGTHILTGATLNAASQEFTVWGTLRIDGQLVNGGILSGTFNLYATGNIPVFSEMQYGITGSPGAECNLYTHAVALNGIQSIDGGLINTNGFQICVPPTPAPGTPTFSNISPTAVTLSWNPGGGDAFVVAREGALAVKPPFGVGYTSNAVFGSGDEIGTDNFLVYSGAANTVTVTGLTPGTSYDFDLYSYTTSIGGCYGQNVALASVTTCNVISAPTGATNAQYCTGDVKPAVRVNSPGVGFRIRWFDAPSAGNLVAGDATGGDGLGEVFIPNAPSGTFYAEVYDEVSLCPSSTRTAVTLTLHPPLVAGVATGDQDLCSGLDPTLIDGGSATGGTGAFTYTWESANAAIGPWTVISGETDATYDPPAGILQTTYFHRITRSATCLQTGNAVVVNVTPDPVIALQPATVQVCEGDGTTLSIVATGVSLTYQWRADTGSGFADLSDNSIYTGTATDQLTISDVTGLNLVRYQCAVTAAGSCRVTSSTVPLTVNARPSVVNQGQAVCENILGTGLGIVDLTSLNTSVSGGAGGLTIAWFNDQGLANPVASPSAVTTNSGRVFYARVSNNTTSCFSTATATITVTSKPAGSGVIAGSSSICTNAEATYTVTGISNQSRYTWNVSAGLEVVSQNGATVTIRGTAGESGTISVAGENSCGTGAVATLPVQIQAAPEAQIIAPSEVVVNEPASFSFETAAADFGDLNWDFGDGELSSDQSPEHTYTADGTYDVSLTLMGDNGCEGRASITILVLPLPELSDYNIKNVITANGDTQNGFLYIEDIEKYPSNQVVLMDRWGVEVFKQENYLNDWDARRNGEYLPVGQYVCVVKLNETGKIFSRTVSIIKRK